MMPVRVGFTPTSARVMWLSGVTDAATMRKAADEMSPATVMSSGWSGVAGRSLWMVLPYTSMGAPMARSMRSVWSRAGPGSRTMVRPLA